ncbi:hypothetical protein R6Q59_018445 [Mikania micrantha]
MEIRNQNYRLDVHEQQIKQLQSDVTEIKQLISDAHTDSVEFRKLMLNWMKQFKKKSVASATLGTGPFFNDPFKTPIHFFSHDSSSSQFTKVNLPEFSGFDPKEWIKKTNLYFDLHHTPDELRLRLAHLRMVGVAQHWFRVITQIWESITWPELQSKLLQRFGGLETHNPSDQLATIQQLNLTPDFIDDVKDTWCPDLVVSKASLSPFSFQHSFGPLTGESLKCWVKGSPKVLIHPN